jgi:glycosyltransferase involved in cell wall biosynthesis
MRVALVHDYLNQAGGAEKVARVFCDLFPGAPLFTSVYDAAAMPDAWRAVDVRTSFLQHLSPRLKVAKMLLPLYPAAFESFDLRGYDLVLSSCSTFAKGVLTSPGSVHVSYCHNTNRPLWMYHDYVAHESLGRLQRAVLPAIMGPLRLWDLAAAQRVDHFVANSRATAERIAKFYRRDALVLEPPIRLAEFAGETVPPEEYFLIISRLQSYKRLDIAVEAASRSSLPLVVAGRGPDAARLRALAGPTVRFVGAVSDAERVRLLKRCRALIVPGREDFGLTSLEAQAAGRPVIAYAQGGSLETVVPGQTGLLFGSQGADALAALLQAFDATAFSADACRAQAARFDEPVFKQRLLDYLQSLGLPVSGGGLSA